MFFIGKNRQAIIETTRDILLRIAGAILIADLLVLGVSLLVARALVRPIAVTAYAREVAEAS